MAWEPDFATLHAKIPCIIILHSISVVAACLQSQWPFWHEVVVGGVGGGCSYISYMGSKILKTQIQNLAHK